MSHSINHSYRIGGMNSSECATTVKHKLFAVFGVSLVTVDLGNEQAEITSFEEIKTDTFKNALNNTNYTISEKK